MAAAQLRLLRIFALELIADVVKQREVALLGIFLERGDKGPGHGASSLTTDLSVLPVTYVSKSFGCTKKR